MYELKRKSFKGVSIENIHPEIANGLGKKFLCVKLSDAEKEINELKEIIKTLRHPKDDKIERHVVFSREQANRIHEINEELSKKEKG